MFPELYLQSFLHLQVMPSSMGIPSLVAALSEGGQRPNTSHSHAGGGGRSRSRSSVASSSATTGRSAASQARRFQRMFDSMKSEVQAAHLGLMGGAPVIMEERKSRCVYEGDSKSSPLSYFVKIGHVWSLSVLIF